MNQTNVDFQSYNLRLRINRILTCAEFDDVTVSGEVFEVAFDGGSAETWAKFEYISLSELAEIVVDSVLNGVERCRDDNLNLLVEINI